MLYMWAKQKQQFGFTIVELLVVIVVIGILAAITVVSYNGIQNRGYDTAVQSDLKNIAKQLELYNAEKSVYPVGGTQLATLGIKVTKSAYGNGFGNNIHNLVYCRVTLDGPNMFALVAASKSGNLFTYKSATGLITQSTAWAGTGTTTICQDAGVMQIDGNDRDIFYYNSAWQSAYISG
ncbi:type II secretion system protein G [compost metagenome]